MSHLPTSWRDDLTWTCHSCGEERPDAAISVEKRLVKTDLPDGHVTQNLRHCNDRPECVEKLRQRPPLDLRKDKS